MKLLEFFTDPTTGLLSTSRISAFTGNLVGAFVCVWLTVYKEISFDILAVYLAFASGLAGWNRYVGARFGSKSLNDKQGDS
jgi:uncharacterized membrane protein